MREIDWKMRVSAHHMDHLSEFSALVFVIGQNLSLNVEDMAIAALHKSTSKTCWREVVPFANARRSYVTIAKLVLSDRARVNAAQS